MRRVRAAGAALLLAAAALAPGTPALAAGPDLPDRSVMSAEGATVTIDLLSDVPDAAPGSARLLLDGLPPRSTLTSDGRLVVVPQQGIWQISDDGASVTFTPIGPRVGAEPAPIRYTAEDAAGEAGDPGVVSITTPVIQDAVRSNPFGQPIEFPVGELAQNVDPASLRLVAVPGPASAVVDADGSSITVAEQGTWTLDRSVPAVRFTPESPEVMSASPIGIRGTDAAGATTATALLRPGYLHLLDQLSADRPGATVQFAPMDASSNVRVDSLRLLDAGLPDGSVVGDDGLSVAVPGEGTWSLDTGTRVARFVPEPGLEGDPTPVFYTGTGLYSDNSVQARLIAQYTDSPPTARTDQLRTRPGAPVSIDLLANDTPGSTTDPLEADTVLLASPVAANVDETQGGYAPRVVIPGEGIYAVSSDGVVTFEPDPSFRGAGTPVRYSVADESGVIVTASIEATVDPQAPLAPVAPDAGGVNSMLEGVRPGGTRTFAVFASFSVLLMFAGAASLWIGGRMFAGERADRE